MFGTSTKPRKPLERADARRLRRQGMSIKRIAKLVEVSPSSVFVWTRDIELTAEQHAVNLRGPRGPLNPETLRKRAAAWSERCRQRRAEFQAEGRARVREADSLYLAGCLLYWAEGTKNRNTVRFSNSDPHMMRLFRRFLTKTLGVKDEDFRLSLNVYTGNGLSVAEIEQHWLTNLELPRSCLCKHILNHLPTSSSGKMVAKLPYGVCTLRVLRSTNLVQQIYGAIQEYGGFDEPRWLD
jgi:hypothetical protein